MSSLTKKQDLRMEKKRKKMAALANLVKMNDYDRAIQAQGEQREASPIGENDELPKVCDDDDGFIKVKLKKKNSRNSKDVEPSIKTDEPKIKRLKATNSSESDGDQPSGNDLTLTDSQYKDVRRQLRERKRQLELFTLRLRENGTRASLEVPQDERTPIFLTDIQHLLMTALLGKKSPCSPERWICPEPVLNLTYTVVLILEGMSLYQFLSNESKFEEASKIFDTRLEVMLPPRLDGAMLNEMMQVPLTHAQAGELINQHGSLEIAIAMNKDPTLHIKSVFPIECEAKEAEGNPLLGPEDKFPRTKLLLSALQMVDEGYPMMLRGELSERFKEYVFTKDMYTTVHERSPMFGVDCEMCRTVVGANELTRISIVNEAMETVYETLVMPTNKITDYLTQYSGITAKIMRTVTKSLKEVQQEVRELLPPDAILVGQSLNSDLNAMKMMHPYVIDTSVCFNLSGVRRRKSKLQTLAMTFLKETIQTHVDGHDSVEDSAASLKLVKMKLANSLEFGDEIFLQKRRINDIMRSASGDCIANNLFAHATQSDKSAAIVTAGSVDHEVKKIIAKAEEVKADPTRNPVALFELNSNQDVIRKTRSIAVDHQLTIANMKIDGEKLQLSTVEKTVGKMDKWIGKLWRSMAHNSMLIVLMGDSEESQSGVAKIAIKKNVADVAADTPLEF